MNEYIPPLILFAGVYMMIMVQALTTHNVLQSIGLKGIPTALGASLIFTGMKLWGVL